MASVLIIDDDRSVRHMIAKAFEGLDVDVIEASSAEEGVAAVAECKPDAVLLDIMLPDVSGLEAFTRLQALDARLPVIFITAGGSSDTAIEAMSLGAFDYVLKPLDVHQVRELVNRAIKTRRLMSVPVALSNTGRTSGESDVLVGRSVQMQELYKSIGRVASQDVAVLIRGESGTGKELVARAIYQHSERADRGFLAVNCAAIPETLLESELFGHEKGAFTGAVSRRIGKFEQCSDGTLFLDEVGDMSPILQAKMLRVLQEQRFERVGGAETIQTNVRIITATNRDLEKMVAENEFRSDLYYRLNGFTIKLPPLRERQDDICLLLEHLLGRFTKELGKDVQGISPDALDLLLSYPWPGNVRELQSVLRQALLVTSGPVLVASFLPIEIREQRNGGASAAGDGGTQLEQFIDGRLRSNSENLFAETVELMEKCLLTRVLKHTEGNQSQAARILGITRGSLRNKIRTLGISIGQVVSVEDDEEPDAAAINS